MTYLFGIFKFLFNSLNILLILCRLNPNSLCLSNDLIIQTTIKELCDTILDLKNSKLKVKYVPYSADDSRALVQNRIGSRQKAEKELGFLYNDSLREGLQKLIDWRKSVGIDKA